MTERYKAADLRARQATAFLMTAKDRLTAGAYEEMLKKNHIATVLESNESTGQYAVIMQISGQAGSASCNIYVPAEQLERARELVDDFDNQPYEYHAPPPGVRKKSRPNQLLFAFFMFLIFVVPIGISIYVIAHRIFRLFAR